MWRSSYRGRVGAPPGADLVPAALLAAAGVAQAAWRPPSAGLPAAVAVTLALTLPLVWRRRWPVAVFAVQFATALAVGGAARPSLGFVAVLVGAYSLAAHTRSATLAFGVLGAAAAIAAVARPGFRPPIPGWATGFAFLLAVGSVGTTIRALRGRADASAERADALRRSQHAATEAALAAERTRLAGELHDIVSHHVSVMVIQAGAARSVLDTDPRLAGAALEAIRTSGTDAMDELRHLLGLLTTDGDPVDGGEGDGAPLHPQPGLDQLPALTAKMRASGQPVTVEHVPVDLPRGVDIAAYRVVQEALTNALRYAPGAPTAVVVRSDAGALVVEVTDDGAAEVPARTGTGSGLRGLAERVALYGGTLDAGRRPGGGFRVQARIPLQPARSAVGP